MKSETVSHIISKGSPFNENFSERPQWISPLTDTEFPPWTERGCKENHCRRKKMERGVAAKIDMQKWGVTKYFFEVWEVFRTPLESTFPPLLPTCILGFEHFLNFHFYFLKSFSSKSMYSELFKALSNIILSLKLTEIRSIKVVFRDLPPV